jgi:hypothetical protein
LYSRERLFWKPAANDQSKKEGISEFLTDQPDGPWGDFPSTSSLETAA